MLLLTCWDSLEYWKRKGSSNDRVDGETEEVSVACCQRVVGTTCFRREVGRPSKLQIYHKSITYTDIDAAFVEQAMQRF